MLAAILRVRVRVVGLVLFRDVIVLVSSTSSSSVTRRAIPARTILICVPGAISTITVSSSSSSSTIVPKIPAVVMISSPTCAAR